MDVETPAEGRDRSKVFTIERRTFHQRQHKRPGPRGYFPSHHDVGLERPMKSPM
jgi:hypothetical protein